MVHANGEKVQYLDIFWTSVDNCVDGETRPHYLDLVGVVDKDIVNYFMKSSQPFQFSLLFSANSKKSIQQA